MSPDSDAAFSKLSEITQFDGQVISVSTGSFAGPDGSTFERDIMHHPGAVGVVALTESDEIVLVRQYRAPIDEHLLEIPAGIRDIDAEPPVTTAARELAEEAGLEASHLEQISVFHNSPGCSDECVVLFLATGLTAVDAEAHGVEEEHMVVERLPLDAALREVTEQRITDAKTIIGILLVAARRS